MHPPREVTSPLDSPNTLCVSSSWQQMFILQYGVFEQNHLFIMIRLWHFFILMIWYLADTVIKIDICFIDK